MHHATLRCNNREFLFDQAAFESTIIETSSYFLRCTAYLVRAQVMSLPSLTTSQCDWHRA